MNRYHKNHGSRGKIVLVEPKSPDLHIFSIYPLPRLGTVLLGTMLRERGYDVKVVVEEIQPATMGQFEDADLVGISTTTSTANRAYTLADRLRERGKTVVMGGPHVTYMADEAIAHADYLVRGEGERVFPALVDMLSSGLQVRQMPGLIIRGQTPHPDLSQPVENLDSLPFPDFSLIEGSHSWRGIRNRRVIPVQASRGCPHNCSFCSVTGMFGRKVRYKSVARILEELERHDRAEHHIFFYDDNLGADREWLRETLSRLVSRGTAFTWSAQVRADIARDRELLKLMAASGCKTVFIGFESMDHRTLQLMNKGQSPADIRQAVSAFNRFDIPVHGMFVLGFDSDTPETLEATISYARRSGISTVQFLILTPLPGTDTYDQLHAQGRILFDDWSLYDGHHVTFRPSGMSPLALQRSQISGHKEFYSIRRLVNKAMTGSLEHAAVYAYAQKLNFTWKRKNRLYLKALRLISESRGVITGVNFHHPTAQVTGF